MENCAYVVSSANWSHEYLKLKQTAAGTQILREFLTHYSNEWVLVAARTHVASEERQDSALDIFILLLWLLPFFGLNCPAVAFGHFSLFLVEFVLLFMLYFFLERRCATAFKICTAFDILINHASRRMSHSQSVGTGHKGGWVLKEGLSHCELNFKQAKWEAKQHLLSKSARSKRFKKEAANSDNRQQDWKRKNEEKNDNKNMPNVKYPFSFILVKNVLRIYIANR